MKVNSEQEELDLKQMDQAKLIEVIQEPPKSESVAIEASIESNDLGTETLNNVENTDIVYSTATISKKGKNTNKKFSNKKEKNKD